MATTGICATGSCSPRRWGRPTSGRWICSSTRTAELREPLTKHLDETLPEEPDANARKRAIRALALDLMRGLLPAGTVSNVGMFASPQAYEQLVLRLRAHPLPEARAYAELVNAELQQLIPDFLTRLDRPERGGVWVDYLRETAAAVARGRRPARARRTSGARRA